jgi:hypothetical protein
MARQAKWIEATFSQEEAARLLSIETVVHHGPNDCWLSTRATEVGAYPRKQLTVAELPQAMKDDDKQTLTERKALRKVSLHVLAARARGIDVKINDISHRCGRGQRTAEAEHWGCINPAHMVAESHAQNMRRINCIIECPHCGDYVCRHGSNLPEGAAGRPGEGKTTDHLGCLA